MTELDEKLANGFDRRRFLGPPAASCEGPSAPRCSPPGSSSTRRMLWPKGAPDMSTAELLSSVSVARGIRAAALVLCLRGLPFVGYLLVSRTVWFGWRLTLALALAGLIGLVHPWEPEDAAVIAPCLSLPGMPGNAV